MSEYFACRYVKGIDAYRRGKTLAEAAAVQGCTRDTLRLAMKRLGISRRPRGYGHHLRVPEQRANWSRARDAAAGKIRDYRALPVAVLAYAAGLIDGEGCIRIGPYKDNSGKVGYRAAIQLGMTNRAAVEWLRDNLGGNFYIGRTSYDHRKPAFNWVMWTRGGAALLEALLPYLVVKREQAALFLEFSKTLDRHRAGCPLPAEINAARAAMSARSRELNAKGVP